MRERSCTFIIVLPVLAIFFLQPLAAQQTPSRFLALETVLQGEDFGDLRWPVGVAAGSAEQVAVADIFGQRLVVFVLTDGTWTVERTVSLPSSPRGVAHDGRRYLLSLGGGLVTVEGSDFEVERLALPAGVVVGRVAAKPGGGFWVHDTALGKVLALDAKGGVQRSVSVTGRIVALASAPNEGFYTALADVAQVRRHDREGHVLKTWTVPGVGPVPAWPSGLVAAAGGDIVVVDRHGARILALDASGRLTGVGSGRGWEPGQLRFPTAIAMFSDGRLVVADQGNSRVQIFRPIDRGGSTP